MRVTMRVFLVLLAAAYMVAPARAQVVLERATVVLTDAEIKALPSTPVVVVPAAGAGRVIVPIAGAMRMNATFGAYTALATNRHIAVGYPNGNYALNPMHVFPHAAATDKFGPLAILSDDGYGSGSSYISVSVFHNTATFDNAPLVVTAQNEDLGDFTGGHPSNTLTVTVWYLLVDL